MSHLIRVDSKSALVGVAAALVCVVAFGQVSVSRATTPTAAIAPGQGIGNPHPRDMVHLTPPGGLGTSVQVNGPDLHEVYAVPSDKWLVLLPSTQYFLPNWNAPAVSKLTLLEDQGGSLKKKAEGASFLSDLSGPSGNAVGWTFSPGSRVLIQAAASDPYALSYSIFGYLTDL